MTEVVSVKFRKSGKSHYFDPAGLTITPGQALIVETSKGLEIGDCSKGNHMVQDEHITPPLRPVVRLATEDDQRVAAYNREREKEAFAIGLEKIAAHGLDMKLVDVECGFEGNKILFFFTADGRVDFRELVKDLASVFRTRIELRQIGVRDEAKMLGGLGICGRPFCCSQFLNSFQPVSTKMAKAQSMSLNPTKISGTCGRLMCCLRYEQEAYEDLIKHVPKNGAFVQTPDGYGNVTLINLLRQTVKVKLDGDGDAVIRTYDVDEIAEVPGGRPKPGEQPPSVLVIKPKPKEKPHPIDDGWDIPELIPEAGENPAPEEPKTEPPREEEKVRRSRSRRSSKGKATAKALVSAQNARPKAPVRHPGKSSQQQKPRQQAGPAAAAQTPAAAASGEAPQKRSRYRHFGKSKFGKRDSRGSGESKSKE
ncbi:MAG: stage 0 sporulation family protein [Eubacteriales bacterium]|nr:stage 0 sporulation family protein [Eubacteriales bacterium]